MNDITLECTHHLTSFPFDSSLGSDRDRARGRLASSRPFIAQRVLITVYGRTISGVGYTTFTAVVRHRGGRPRWKFSAGYTTNISGFDLRQAQVAAGIVPLALGTQTLARWMSPYPGKVQCAAEADVRVGGTFKLSMQSDHSTCEIEGQYVVVDPPRLLAFTWCGPPTQNANTLVTVELKSISGGTELTLTHEKLPTAELRAAHEIGWANMFDHLIDVVD